MRKENNKKIINMIAKKVANISRPVADEYIKQHKELEIFPEFCNVEYIPTPFEIADFYSIDYHFIKLEGEIPSYLTYSLGVGDIFISDRYRKESFEAKILCAHELGHFFLHKNEVWTMNNDYLVECMPESTLKEYEANVFTIFLMPQIMVGSQWENLSPKILNRKVFKKATRDIK